MDYSKPIKIAPDIYWVGYVIPDDPFQCHVYLIKNGKESILIDPGSMITFPVVLEKITSILPLKDIKYIIMHHQDPDIVGCYSTLEKLFPKGERYIATHWRTEMLLKHYQWETPFYLVNEHNWQLKTKNRELEFVFTPYAHFAGAFCTYDKKSKILFSSDLFGGLTPKFELFAKNADEYFEHLKPFHQHYIPNKEILNYAIYHIEQKDISLIAPQHGSIIKKEILPPLIEKMKELDCGLYLMDDYVSDIDVLSKTDEIFKRFIKDTISLSSFELILKNFFLHTKEILPSIEKIKICANSPYSQKEYCFEYKNYALIEIENNEEIYSLKKELLNEKNQKIGDIYVFINNEVSIKDKKILELLLKRISTPLAVSLEKELLLKELEENNEILYKKAITDALTGVYNREFMKEFLSKKIEESKRYHFPLSIAIIDIDFFKKINDTYGHLTGDCVLKELSNLMKKNFRGSDTIIRYGGEEFLIIMPFTNLNDAYLKIERFRKSVENYLFCKKQKLHITISAGVTELENEDMNKFIQKADEKLYKAKDLGRNKVIK